MKKELIKIFRQYKRKYKLKTRLAFIDNEFVSYSGEYNNKLDIIDINLACLGVVDLIFTTLHEIKHAIDWTREPKKCLRETNLVDWHKYNMDYEYSGNRNFEKRADKFARTEIQKINKAEAKLCKKN